MPHNIFPSAALEFLDEVNGMKYDRDNDEYDHQYMDTLVNNWTWDVSD